MLQLFIIGSYLKRNELQQWIKLSSISIPRIYDFILVPIPGWPGFENRAIWSGQGPNLLNAPWRHFSWPFINTDHRTRCMKVEIGQKNIISTIKASLEQLPCSFSLFKPKVQIVLGNFWSRNANNKHTNQPKCPQSTLVDCWVVSRMVFEVGSSVYERRDRAAGIGRIVRGLEKRPGAVSYTHLTLPTNREV